eukprot:TRINITY_DN2622_c0_g1_i2.p1 TRINITY_DN2622_c0_g1~~TRINITY_DN2622_c0_g1_i2.p1  ORF type:complete len:470 (-),score=77.32 TRINITY_DN2622_c0_g1_i2:831-2240(-)
MASSPSLSHSDETESFIIAVQDDARDSGAFSKSWFLRGFPRKLLLLMAVALLASLAAIYWITHRSSYPAQVAPGFGADTVLGVENAEEGGDVGERMDRTDTMIDTGNAMLDIMKHVSKGKVNKGTGKLAADAMHGAASLCMQVCGAATAVTAGAGAPSVAACGGIYFASGMTSHWLDDDDSPDNQDVIDSLKKSIDASYTRLAEKIHVEVAAVQQELKQGIEDVKTGIEQLSKKISLKQVDRTLDVTDEITNLYNDNVLDKYFSMGVPMPEISKLSSFQPDLNDRNFNNFIEDLRGAGYGREETLKKALGFIAARTQLYTLMVLKAEVSKYAEAFIQALTNNLQHDLNQYESVMVDACLHPVRRLSRMRDSCARYSDPAAGRFLKGDLKDLPRSLTIINASAMSVELKGTLSDLPGSATHVILPRCNMISGSLADLPKSATYLDFSWNEKISGNVADLPKSATKISYLP